MAIPVVISDFVNSDDFRFQRVVTRSLLVLWAHETARAALVVACTVIQQELGHDRIFVDDGHVQHVLPCHSILAFSINSCSKIPQIPTPSSEHLLRIFNHLPRENPRFSDLETILKPGFSWRLRDFLPLVLLRDTEKEFWRILTFSTITVVLLVHVDVVDEFGEEFDESFRQIRVEGRRTEQTQVQDCLTDAAAFCYVPARLAKLGYIFHFQV